MLSLIVAYDENHSIGFQGKLPWSPIPEDMRHFRSRTMTAAVIMGRTTWESLGCKPLVHRHNIILSHSNEWRSHQPEFVNDHRISYVESLENALEIAEDDRLGCEHWIIGGGTVYKEALQKNLIDKIVASEIKGKYLSDTFFPVLDDGWKGSLCESFEQFNIVEYKKHD